MIHLRVLVLALVVAFVSGLAVGALGMRREPNSSLQTCQRYLGQNRPDACDLLEHAGAIGSP